jgi:hypothetical protein
MPADAGPLPRLPVVLTLVTGSAEADDHRRVLAVWSFVGAR